MERSFSPQSVVTEATEFFDAEDRDNDHSVDEDGRNVTPTPNEQGETVASGLTSEAVSQLQSGFQAPPGDTNHHAEGSYDAYMTPLQAAISAAKATSQSDMTDVDLDETHDSTLLNTSAASTVLLQPAPLAEQPATAPAAAVPSSPAFSLPQPPAQPPSQSPSQSRPRKSTFVTYMDAVSAWTGSTMLRAERSIRERFNGRVVPEEDQVGGSDAVSPTPNTPLVDSCLVRTLKGSMTTFLQHKHLIKS